MKKYRWVVCLLGGLLTANEGRADVGPPPGFDPAPHSPIIESLEENTLSNAQKYYALGPGSIDDLLPVERVRAADPRWPEPVRWRILGAFGQNKEIGYALVIAMLLAVLMARAARQHTGEEASWHARAVLAALLPLFVGEIFAEGHLFNLDRGLRIEAFSVPREAIFRYHAQLARDSFLTGLLASLAALLFAALVTLARRSPSKPDRRALWIPAAWATLLLGGGGYQRAHEALKAREVSGALDALRQPKAPRLAEAKWLAPVPVPDAPLLLVNADGLLRYDGSRGRMPPGRVPRFPETDRSSWARGLPFFLLAIDGSTPWKTLLDTTRNIPNTHDWQFIALLEPRNPVDPGARPQAPLLSLWHAAPRRYGKETTFATAHLSEGGLNLSQDQLEIADGCGTTGEGPAVPRERLSLGAVSACLQRLGGLLKGSHQKVVLKISFSEMIPWSEVVLVHDAIAAARAAGALDIEPM